MTHASKQPRRAFTLIELLVVIGVIGILMAIGFGVARGVRANARRQLTNSALTNLESMLDEYISEVGKVPAIPDGNRDGILEEDELADFYRYPDVPLNLDDSEYIFGVSAFVRQVRGVGSVDDMLAGLSEKVVVRRRDIELYDLLPPNPSGGFLGSGFDEDDEAQAVTLVDGDGNEIYYIHPSVRETDNQSLLDELNTAKRFGIGLSGRPYFMSVGPDGKAGDRETDLGQKYLADNIYSAEPAGVHDGA